MAKANSVEDTFSLGSVDLPPSLNEEEFPQLSAILVDNDITPDSTSRLSVHQIPTFRFTPADGHTNVDQTIPNREEDSPINYQDTSQDHQSVFSVLKQPLKNAFSLLIQRFTKKAKGQDSDHEDDLSEDSSLNSDPEGSVPLYKVRKHLDSLAGSEYDDSDNENGSRRKSLIVRLRMSFSDHRFRGRFKPTFMYHIDPQGGLFLLWMTLVCVTYIYNAVAIPLRVSFSVYPLGGLGAWLVFDYLCDLVYVCDILLVQSHVSFRTQGVLERDLRLLATRYMKTKRFFFDCVSLLPLDILYVVPVLKFHAMLRLPRLLKFGSLALFRDCFESWTRFPHGFRMFKLVALFLYIIHLYTCVYHLVSVWEGLGSTEWVYDGNGIDYLRCFYWATITVITSHDAEERNPVTTVEYLVEMFAYLIGVFVLAIIIGEIRNIVEAANSNKTEAHRKWDRVKEYMSLWHIPNELQDRIQSWYDNILLTEQCLLDEDQMLDSLPIKMKADLAIHVHLDTLSKVSLLRDLEKSLLRELVLKLRPVLFVPGDYICRKGEIGKEMYIVNHGEVQVVGGAENIVLAELGPGAVFGEISLLSVGGGNRRTAHVRSKGFAKLFVLSKTDLRATLMDYPEAQEKLKKRTKHVSKRDKRREKRQSITRPAVTNQERSTQASKPSVTIEPMDLATEESHVTHAEVHYDPSEDVRKRGVAFETVAPETKMRVGNFTDEPPRADESKGKFLQSSFWPSDKDVVMTTDTNSLVPSMASIETGDIGFFSEDSLFG